MSENAPPEADKNRRSRSFGSFLLVLLVLLVVLAIVGGDRLAASEELTEDQFQWHLNRGDVISQELRGTEQGTNKIIGMYRKAGEPEPVQFQVSFATLEEREEHFRQLGGIREYEFITGREFLDGIERGRVLPVEARLLTAFDAKLPVGAKPDSENPPKKIVEKQDALMVSAIVRAQGGANAKNSGKVYYDVDLGRNDDLAMILGAIESMGAKVTRQTFNLSKGEGTSWKPSNSVFSSFLLYMAPWVLLFILVMIFMRQMRSQGGAGGVMSFGRSRAQLYSKENLTNVTFDDVAGAEEAKSEVREIVEFLKNPTRFTRIGGRIPRGVLLVGSPGCGKTLLAKAIAGEAEAPFFSISGSDFVEMFVGVGASRVRDLFKQARESSPCIIFLDEIDAVGRRRGSGMGGGHDEREQTLNAILVEMDGFGTDEGIIVVAATNRPDVLDPALLRPGRFDREVTIDMPDVEGRAQILNVHLKKVKASKDIDVTVVAKTTPGYSGADLAAIINEAAIMAVLAKRDEVTMEDLEESRDKVRFGRQKKSRKLEEADRLITAYHEAGHAIVAAEIEEVDPPHKVTIVPRGRALGSTMILPDKESYHMQKKKLLGQLAMLFGGRVAEAIKCGDISAGASDDISRATDLARAMVSELGMSEKIGPINYAERQGSDFLGTELMRGKLHSESTAQEIDGEVRRILGEAYSRAEAILKEHDAALEHLAQGLLAFETINGKEIIRLIAGDAIEDLRPKPVEESTPPPAPRADEDVAPDPGHSGELPGNPGLSPA